LSGYSYTRAAVELTRWWTHARKQQCEREREKRQGPAIRKSFSPNISRSTGTHYGVLLDMDAGTLQYWMDGVDLGAVAHPTLSTGTWYVTCTFGSGAAGANYQLRHPPSARLPVKPLLFR